VLSDDADAVWVVLLELLELVLLELVVDATLLDVLAVLELPSSNWVRSVCSWASRDCRDSNWLVNWSAGVELLLADDAVLLVDEALTELVLVLALVESELPVATAAGCGGGCCSDASSSSSTLDNSVELSLLLVEVEALVALDALDALVASVLVLDVLSPAVRPDRKLMFSSWK